MFLGIGDHAGTFPGCLGSLGNLEIALKNGVAPLWALAKDSYGGLLFLEFLGFFSLER